MVKYNINRAAERILDLERHPDLRAIDLFVFIVALHAGKATGSVAGSSSQPEGNTLIVDVPPKTLRDARLLAGMKFLESIEKRWREKNVDKKPTLRRMAANPRFKRIYDKVILRYGSWYKLRYSVALRDLEHSAKLWTSQAKDVAHLIEFSVRFAPNVQKPKQVGGITMAVDILAGEDVARHFGTRVKKTVLNDEWSRLKCAAPFLYLLYVQKHDFDLNGITSANFAKKWRKRAKNNLQLEEFFTSYNSLVAHLIPRNYNYPQLSLRPDSKCCQIDFGSFQAKRALDNSVLIAIDGYRS